MHSLSVAQVWVQLAEHEEYVQQHSLRIWLAEIEVLGYAAVDVLLDLGAEFFVLTEGRP